MDSELAKAYIASFAPDQPAPRTIHEAGEDNKPRRNVQTAQRLAAGSTPCPSTQAGPEPKIYCDTCQSSPFETPANKAATYIPSALNSHKLNHHNDEQEFRTWMLFHRIDLKRHECPICLRNKPSKHDLYLQLHLLEQHYDDVPTKLPPEIFSLVYRLCADHCRSVAREVACRFKDMVMQLERNSAAAPKRKALAEIREDGGEGTGTRDQGNKKAIKVGDMGYLRSVYDSWQRSL